MHSFDIFYELLTSEQLADLLRAPLKRAAATGNTELAQRLVHWAGAEIGDALYEAVRGGHGEIVNNVLESGASTVAKDGNGDTPLHIAAYRVQTEICSSLLLKGADKDGFDDRRRTPRYLAALKGRLDVVLALLATRAVVSFWCGEFKAQLILAAAEIGPVEILRAVIEHGRTWKLSTHTKNSSPSSRLAQQARGHRCARRGWGQHRSTRSLWPHVSTSASCALSHENLLCRCQRKRPDHLPRTTIDMGSKEVRLTRSCRGDGLSTEGRCGRDSR